MIIELVGLPGSGKSTFARSLCENGGYTRIKILNKRELFFYNFIFLLWHPVIFFQFLHLVVKYRGPRYLWRFKFITIFLDYNAKYIKAKQIDKAILDQGHTQVFFSLFEDLPPHDEIDRILSFLPKSDQYIVFDTDLKVREGRLGKRSYNLRSFMSDTERAHWKTTIESIFSSACSSLEELHIPTHIVNDNYEAIINLFVSKKSLYYVHSSRIPTEKAYGNQISVMCQSFAEIGYRVEVWSPSRLNPVTESLFEYYDIPQIFSHRILKCSEFEYVRKFLKKIAFYLEQLSFLYSLSKTSLPKDAIVYVRRPEVAWVLIRKGNRVVFECHEWSDTYVWLRLWLLKGVARIVTTNNFIKAQFVDCGVDSNLFVIAPNGVSYNTFAIDDSKEVAVEKLKRNNIQFPDIPDTSILLYTGNFKTMGQEKGISDIMHSLQHITDEKVHFVAVGGTQEHIDEYLKMAEKLGVTDRVSFFGRVSKNNLALFQRAADIMMMPFPKMAHYEYFMSPLKIFEYMAGGRPILTTNLPSILEILNEQSAFFCEPDNPKNIAKKVISVLQNKEESVRRAMYAREDVVQYTWSNRASSVLADINV